MELSWLGRPVQVCSVFEGEELPAAGAAGEFDRREGEAARVLAEARQRLGVAVVGGEDPRPGRPG